LKRCVCDLLPASVRRRHKQPYRAPGGKTVFQPASPDYVGELLSPERISQDGIFDPEAVEGLTRKFRQGRAIGLKDNGTDRHSLDPTRDRSVPTGFSKVCLHAYTKVTYSERRSRRKMEVSDWYGGAARHHAAKTHGCSYAGTLFTRVFLAAPRGQWKVLPSLPGVRDRLPVRLEDHAPRKSG
jgi:hypothetical protein